MATLLLITHVDSTRATDRNGITDLVLVFPTGGNGWAPQNHLVTVTFESSGRPISWEADGYFEETNTGIADLVDLNRDGRADLVYEF